MWYTIENEKGIKVIVKEITPYMALRKAESILKRESKVKGLKNIYKHTEAYWTDLNIVEVKK